MIAGAPAFDTVSDVPIYETVLVFVGIPAGIVALVFFAVYGKSMLHQPNRYRPGRPWAFAPTWYVPHPDAVLQSARPQLTAGSTTAVGGASGEW